MDQDIFPLKPNQRLELHHRLILYMSRSLNDFQNLNIGDMPETRSRTQRGQQGARRPGAGRSSGRGGHVPIRSNPPIHSHSGLLYNTENLSPGSAQRATEGLLTEYFVDQLRAHQPSQGTTYYAFQLKKPVSVRIYDPANGIKVECTCDDYQQFKSACAHIYWLFDGLRAVLTGDNSNATTYTVAKEEVVKQLSELYEPIGQQLQLLPDLLNRTRGDEAESDSDQSETEDSPASSNSSTRKEIVRDMLSVFDHKALPSEYGADFSERAPVSTPGTELYVPGNLAATIYGIAIRDETFFRRLRKVVTTDICAEVYFRKQFNKARELMAHLDRFAESGLSRPVEARDVNVPVCAQGLRLIVHQICENRDVRTARRPLGSQIISRAVEILVEILYEVVCNRNKDIFGRVPQQPHGEDHGRDHNLFAYLIGNPPPLDSSSPVAMGGDFIIDCLRGFPATECRPLLERLTTIMDSIHEHAPREERAVAYAAKLENMLGEYTADVFEPSSSSAQLRRPTVTSPRESQRRRIQ